MGGGPEMGREASPAETESEAEGLTDAVLLPFNESSWNTDANGITGFTDALMVQSALGEEAPAPQHSLPTHYFII